jgi:hypothetical protein
MTVDDRRERGLVTRDRSAHERRLGVGFGGGGERHVHIA